MNNLSSIVSNPTQKTLQIFKGCEDTGLPKEVVQKIFESSNDFLGDIVDMTKPKEVITSNEFKTSLATVFSELDSDKLKDGAITAKFLDILYDMAETKIDSVNLISVVKDIFELKDLKNLNEEQKNLSVIYDEPVMLFEGLKTILSKNTKRWGTTYHLDNVYKTLMDELAKEVEQIQLSKKLSATNSDFHLMIINDLMSGGVSPINKNVSAVKEMIPDLQTLVFDITLIIGIYIVNSNSTSLKYVKRQTYNEYYDSLNDLLSRTISSSSKSPLLKQTHDTPEEIYPYDSDGSVAEKLISKISPENLKNSLWNQSDKGVFDMLNFLMSCSTEIGLPIRQALRLHNTKAMELCNDIIGTRIKFSRTQNNF